MARVGRWSLACVLTYATTAAAAGREAPLTTAALLVDLARDHALQQQGRQTPADVQHVRALLRAALRLDASLVPAYGWLCELAILDGDQAEATRLLEGLLAAEPAHELAFANWLTAGIRTRQTAEARREWLESPAVRAAARTSPQQAAVRAALARLALEQLDAAAARAAALEALALDPANLEAAELLVEAQPAEANPAERLADLLRLLELAPHSVATAWQTAAVLDEAGYVEEAGRLYQHALDTQLRSGGGEGVPAGLLLALARNLSAQGHVEAAITQARAALADPQTTSEAGLLLHYLLARSDPAEAARLREALAQRFASLREPGDWPANELAQAAWFYLTLEPQPDRALMLARAAADRVPRDPFVQRVLGWAQAAAGLTEEARDTLAPLAERDPYAAGRLAQLLRDGGDAPRAAQVLANLDARPTTGPAADLLAELERGGTPGAAPADTRPAETAPASRPAETQAAATRPATSPTARRQNPEIARVLRDFDSPVLDFGRDPARFLEARIVLENTGPVPGEPWWATFSLTNVGPFAITLGPEGMVNPVFLLSFTMEGDRQREFPAIMTVSLDAVRALRPGQSVHVRRTLDVGPPGLVGRQTPQQLQRIGVRAILDAVRAGDGPWRPAPGGQVLPPVYFNRLPAATSREVLATLFAALHAEPGPDAFRAIATLAELLGERRRADLKGGLPYRPGQVPADRISAALVELLAAESWELRARALAALPIAGLDRATVAAAEGCLDHPHWVVRLLAVRLLALQGAAFGERAATIAREDADELVRALAATCMPRP